MRAGALAPGVLPVGVARRPALEDDPPVRQRVARAEQDARHHRCAARVDGDPGDPDRQRGRAAGVRAHLQGDDAAAAAGIARVAAEHQLVRRCARRADDERDRALGAGGMCRGVVERAGSGGLGPQHDRRAGERMPCRQQDTRDRVVTAGVDRGFHAADRQARVGRRGGGRNTGAAEAQPGERGNGRGAAQKH